MKPRPIKYWAPAAAVLLSVTSLCGPVLAGDDPITIIRRGAAPTLPDSTLGDDPVVLPGHSPSQPSRQAAYKKWRRDQYSASPARAAFRLCPWL